VDVCLDQKRTGDWRHLVTSGRLYQTTRTPGFKLELTLGMVTNNAGLTKSWGMVALAGEKPVSHQKLRAYLSYAVLVTP